MSTSLFTSLPRFKSLDADFSCEDQEHSPEQTYADGYQAGIGINREKHKIYQQIIRSGVAEMRKAQQEVEQRHSTAILSVLGSVLPELIPETTFRTITESIQEAARNSLDVALMVKANTQLCSEIAPILADMGLPNITLIPDATVAHFDVQLIWPDGGVDLNLDRITSKCLA